MNQLVNGQYVSRDEFRKSQDEQNAINSTQETRGDRFSSALKKTNERINGFVPRIKALEEALKQRDDEQKERDEIVEPHSGRRRSPVSGRSIQSRENSVSVFNDSEEDEIESINGWTSDPRPEIRMKSGRTMNVYNRRAPFNSSLAGWQPRDKVKIKRDLDSPGLDPYTVTNLKLNKKPSVKGNPDKSPCSII